MQSRDRDPVDGRLLRSSRAAAPRTLVDIFAETVDAHPDAAAIDNGAERLTYAEVAEAAQALAAELNAAGIGRGHRVGVRAKSGTTSLYVAVIGVLVAGAAYVPVEAEDPDERARVVFDASGVSAIVGNDLTWTPRGDARHRFAMSPRRLPTTPG